MTEGIEYIQTPQTPTSPKDNFLNYDSVENGVHFKFVLQSKLDSYYSMRGNNFLPDGRKISWVISDTIYDQISETINVQNIIGVEGNETYLSIHYLSQDGKEKEMVVSTMLDSDGEIQVLGDSGDDVYAHRKEVLSQLAKDAEEIDRLLDAMEYMFRKNDGGYIDETDILDVSQFGGQYKGMDLRSLQKALDNTFSRWEGGRNIFYGEALPGDMDFKIAESEERYLTILMGIGDKYEGGAEYLERKPEQFENFLKDVIASKTIPEMLDYIIGVHQQIDDNDKQSAPVKEANMIFTIKLHQLAWKRLQIADLSSKTGEYEDDCLRLARIITGHEPVPLLYMRQTQRLKVQPGEATRENDIDDTIRYSSENQDIANDIVIHLMTKEGGIMDKMRSGTGDKIGVKIQDPEIPKWKRPSKVIQELKSIAEALLTDDKGNPISGDTFIYGTIEEGGLGFSSLENMSDVPYSELNIEQQVLISILARLREKMRRMVEFEGRGKERKIKKIPVSEVGRKAMPEVIRDAHGMILSGMEDLFSSDNPLNSDFYFGKSAEELGLTGTDAEIYSFFKEIKGTGLFDLSETSVENLKTATMFAGVVGLAMLTPYAFALAAGASLGTVGATVAGYNLVLTGAMIGGGASVASIVLGDRGYASVGEALTDISSDLILGIVTGAGGGILARGIGLGGQQLLSRHGIMLPETSKWVTGLGQEGAKLFSAGGARNAAVFATDIGVMGFTLEAGRQKYLDSLFHPTTIFGEEKK